MTRKKEERVAAWYVEDGVTGEYFVYGYRCDARDKMHDLRQEAFDGEFKLDAVMRPLVFHDPKAAGELRRLRAFVKSVAALERNDPSARKGKRWDILSDVLNDIIDEARTLAKKGKKR